MVDGIDIHGFVEALKARQELIRNLGVSKLASKCAPISQRNADLILGYDRTRSLEGIKPATRIAVLTWLLSLARILGKDFDKATKDDFKQMVGTLEERYTAWTRTKMRVTFKRFYKWMQYGDDYLSVDEFPEEVRWIKRGMKRSDQHCVQFSDCWTEEEMKRLLAVAEHARDRALISVLTETGARVGELGGLRICDVYQDEFGFLLHLRGKTGERDDRVIYSGPSLAGWLNMHPQRTNPNAPLFAQADGTRPLAYNGILAVLKRLVLKAGLGHKKYNPHIFRHSRATLLAEQGWPEPIIKEYLGWQKDSDMMSTYSHLTSRQANRYVLKAYGIADAEQTHPKLKAQLCATCHVENGPEANFCRTCGRPLTHEAILKYNHEKNKASEVLDRLTQDPEFLNVLKQFIGKLNKKEHNKKTGDEALLGAVA